MLVTQFKFVFLLVFSLSFLFLSGCSLVVFLFLSVITYLSHARFVSQLAARQSKGVKIAIYGSFVLNVVLFAVKIVAVVLSGSLAAIASLIDSFLDLLSGTISPWLLQMLGFGGCFRVCFVYRFGGCFDADVLC